MRRNAIVLLAILGLFLGCTQDENSGESPATTAGDPIVTFLAAANAPTRGTAMSGSLDTDATFWVYATQQRRSGEQVYTDAGAPAPEEVWIDGKEVAYRSIALNAQYHVWTWMTADEYLWPQDIYFVNFYAVHPATAPKPANILTSKVVSYDGTTKWVTGDDDIMWARIEKTHRDKQADFMSVTELLGDNRTVSLTFHHLLSQIAFYGKLSQQFSEWGWTVEVGAITIHNLNAAGSFDLGTADEAAIKLAEASPKVLKNYALKMNAGHQTVASTTVPTDDDGQIPLTSPTDVTMVMPQNPAPWNTANTVSANDALAAPGCYLEIQMKIYDAEGNYHLGSSTTYDTVYTPFETYLKNASTGDKLSWEAAKNYGYTIEFGGGDDATGNGIIRSMSFNAAISPWASATPVNGEAKHERNKK